MKDEQDRLLREPSDAAVRQTSHDLRDSVAAVVIGVQVLRQVGTAGPLAEQTLDMIERQLRRVVQLMDELPDHSGELSKDIESPPPSGGFENGPIDCVGRRR